MTEFAPDVPPVDALILLIEERARELAERRGDAQPPDAVSARGDGLFAADSRSNGTAEDEIEDYIIEVEESERTAEALAARDRVLARLGLDGGRDPGSSAVELSQDHFDRAFTTMVDAEMWDVDSALVVARRGGVSLPTRDLEVPELASFGFSPDVELEADLYPTDGVATVTLLLEMVDGLDAASQPKVRVILEAPQGFRASATLSSEGVAVLRDVPLDSLRDIQLRWEVG